MQHQQPRHRHPFWESRNQKPLWAFLCLLLLLTSCKMAFRAARYNIPDVRDHALWPAHPVHKAGEPFQFHNGTNTGIPDVSEWAFGKWYQPGMTTEEFLAGTGTVAFLVLRGDTILYEQYFNGFHDQSIFNNFSMTKIYLSTLVGIAIEEGYIDSVRQPVSDYLPWFATEETRDITIRHLLQMTSGIKSSEGYFNPWATSTRLYYGDGDEFEKVIRNIEMVKPPGKRYSYANISSQFLGMVLAKATGKSNAQYLEEKIWAPLGMEADASWSLHEDTEVEKAFCCLNARARDYARFGLLILNKGRWQGQQLVPEAWLTEATRLDTTDGARQRYQYHWYTSAEQEDFYGQGLLGQFTYICPDSRTIIVRLGNSLQYRVPWYDYFKIIAGKAHKPQPMPFRKRDLKAYEGTWKFGLSNLGDTSMVGKVARLRATPKGLKVRTNFNKTWHALPESDSIFYNLRWARWLRFRRDEQGVVRGLNWTRRGNSWDLERMMEE